MDGHWTQAGAGKSGTKLAVVIGTLAVAVLWREHRLLRKQQNPQQKKNYLQLNLLVYP